MDRLDNPSGSGLPNSPFRTYSNYIYPKNMEDAIRWALWFWERSHKYRTSINKVASYFLSALSITQANSQDDGVDASLVENFENLLTNSYELMELSLSFGVELAALGNVFVSAERLFSRSLACPTKDCGWIVSLNKLTRNKDYKWENFQFKGICPKCHKHVVYNIKDTPTTDNKGRRLRFVFRNIYDMKLSYNQLTGDYKYLYEIPQHIKSSISQGDSVYLENTPSVFFDACRLSKLIEFPKDKFFSMRTKTLSALDKMYKGWGAPLFLAAFDNLVNFQNLMKFNEAVTRDYINPVRVISPPAQNLAAGSDVNRAPVAGHMFRSFMQDSLSKAKDNPTTWIISPLPVNYQMLGGEAKALAPVDLMEWHETQILSDMGIPQEFRQTSFQVVAQSMGLRMFERQWIHYAKSIDNFVGWAADQVANAHNIEQMTCSLDMTSFVEDDMNKQASFQLMTAGVISKAKVLKRLGIDFEDDLKERIRESEQERQLQTTQQSLMQGEEMLASVIPPMGSVGIGQAQANIQAIEAAAQGQAQPAAGGAMPAGPAGAASPGMPFNQGASQSASIEELYTQGQELAQQLYTAPQNVRTRELENLKRTNPTLHAVVKQCLVDMKQQVASDAVSQSQQG